MILGHDTKQNEQLRNIARNMGFVCDDIEKVKTFIHAYTNIAKTANWETMSMSTAQGASALAGAYYGFIFDGRYTYFAPYTAVTVLRFDTTQLFQTVAAWEKLSLSTICGSALGGYRGGCFDGDYVYYTCDNNLFLLRYNTRLAFGTAAFEKMSASTLHGSSQIVANYWGACFDGTYIYLGPLNSDTFVRFNTRSAFTTAASWEKINMSTAQGAALLDSAYPTNFFDGQYVYYGPENADTFLRFDTTLAFTNSSAWSTINMSTAQGGAAVDIAYIGLTYDGRYLYYSPLAAKTFVRFDTTKSFANSSAWQQMSISTAQGATTPTYEYLGASFDGRYIYFGSSYVRTFIRYDTTLNFTNSSAWSVMSMSTAQGGSGLDAAYVYIGFDGKYVYYVPSDSLSFVRVLACPSNEFYR